MMRTSQKDTEQNEEAPTEQIRDNLSISKNNTNYKPLDEIVFHKSIVM